MSRQLTKFVKSLVPEPYTIMGIRLLPFALGHLFHMRRFECGFANENPDYLGNPLDLYLGISICARTYEDFLDFIKDTEGYTKWHKEWGDKVEEYIRGLPGDDIKEKIYVYFTTKIEDFKKYIKDGIVIPDYWDSNKDNLEHSGAHWSQNVYSNLLSETQFTETQILNMPLAKALSITFKLAENKGALILKSDWELEDEERHEKEMQEVKSG